MPTTAQVIYSTDRLDPVYNAAYALVRVHNVTLVAGTYAKGTAVGELAATPGTFGAYVDAATDGTGVCRGFLQYACVVDGSGNVTLGTAGGGGEYGQTKKGAPVYFGGAFRTSELVGFDAAALADLNGKLVNGSVANGIMEF